MNAVTPAIPARSGTATVEDWARFLRPLIASVRQPPTSDDFRKRVAAIAFACPTVPAEMLTTWRQREAVAKFAWWPAAADIAEWLAPAIAERRMTDALKALPTPKEAPRGPRTVEEITAARASVQAFMAERSAPGGAAELGPVQPRHLSDGLLLDQYERLAAGGNELAATRAKVLRARLHGVPA